MTKGGDFENPLEKAVQLGTIGSRSKQREETRHKEKKQVETTDTPPTTPAVLTKQRTVSKEKEGEKRQQTIYLPPRLIRTLKHHAVDQDTDISSVVQTALEQYFDAQQVS